MTVRSAPPPPLPAPALGDCGRRWGEHKRLRTERPGHHSVLKPPQKNKNNHEWGAPSYRPPLLCHCYLHAYDANKKREAYNQLHRPRPNASDEVKKKNTRRAGDLGVDVQQDVRFDEEVRVHEEETQGETQTQKGLGFPQRLREKKI